MSGADPLASWEALAADTALQDAAAGAEPGDVQALGRLRRRWPADPVAAAMALASARRKLARKWPDAAPRLWADAAAAEQASSQAAAGYKAARFRPDLPIFDLCCGAGLDARALAGRGGATTAVDLDPLRAWMCARNAPGTRVQVADVAQVDTAGAQVHLDPGRREGGRRLFAPEDLLPPRSAWGPLLTRAAGACVKLPPGADLDEMSAWAAGLGLPHSLEVLSEDGRLTQALLWTGALVGPARRSAVLLPPSPLAAGPRVPSPAAGNEREQRVGAPAVPPQGDPSAPLVLSGDPAPAPAFHGEPRWLLEADDAVERTHLLHVLAAQHHLGELHPGLGLLAGGADGPSASAAFAASPWLTPFQILESFAWNEKRARERLAAHGAGLVEVKTRGQAADPDRLQGSLRGNGTERLTLFVLRLGRSVTGWICRRT